VEVVGSNPAVPTIESTTYKNLPNPCGGIWGQNGDNCLQLCRFFPPHTYIICCVVVVASVSIA
jgi:hypothetical protein